MVSFVALPLRKMGRVVCVSGGELFDKVKRFACAQSFDIPQPVKEGGLRVTNWALSRTKIALFFPLRGPHKLA